LYGLDNEQEKMGNVAEIAQLLNIKETRENTSILENNRKNALQAGFNSVSLDRNVDLLVSYGYTVVVVNQLCTVPITRAVDYISSPATNLNTRSTVDPHLVSVYIDQIQTKTSQLRYIGMTSMNTATGSTLFYENNGLHHDQSIADDDLARFIQTFSPVEVIVAHSKSVSTECIKELTSAWGFNIVGEPILNLKPVIYLNPDPIPDSIAYAEAYLEPMFRDRGHLNVLDYINMTRYVCARQAYLYLLNFCEVHNRLLLTSLPIPKIWENSNSLILDNSSIMQLGIAESYYEKQETVLSMLSNNLCSAMGKRLLRERLLNPITNIDELCRRYGEIEKMQHVIPTLIKGETIFCYIHVQRELKGIRDFDRLHRKIAFGTLGPSEFYALNNNYTKTIKLIHDLWPSYNVCSEFQKYITRNSKTLNMEALNACTDLSLLETNIFQRGNYIDVDDISDKLSNIAVLLATICRQFPDAKYHEDDGGAYLSLTKPQFQRLKKGWTDTSSGIKWADLQLDEKNKTNVKVRFDRLAELFVDKQTYISDLRAMSAKYYKAFLQSINLDILSRFTLIVAELDLSAGMACLSTTRSYCKPQLSSDICSFVRTVALRHPIVERHTTYVAHNINLGNHMPDGILLYGVNQTGKSCTMKSLGIAVTMAQAGLFVAASSFQLCPYELLLTRILSNDNLSCGLSTFAIEMLELRSILCRCNNKTLVLGDEVCHGTETSSAVSLVGASIIHMAKVKANFIFATHLHELSKMTEIHQLTNVKQCHLSISFKGTDIIYERQIKDGAGTKLYGLEVARFLNVPELVMDEAYKIRNKYYNNDTIRKQSEYNKDVYLTVCAICNEFITLISKSKVMNTD
jgi:DNA mismatch repair protein MutS